MKVYCVFVNANINRGLITSLVGIFEKREDAEKVCYNIAKDDVYQYNITEIETNTVYGHSDFVSEGMNKANEFCIVSHLCLARSM